MVVIRLARTGAKKRPFYHVVVADKRMARDGRYIKRVGYFNPIASGNNIRLKLDRELINGWLAKGAQPSGRVGKLIKEFDLHANGEAVIGEVQDKTIEKRHAASNAKKAAAAKAAEAAAAAEKAAEEAAAKAEADKAAKEAAEEKSE